MKNSFRGKKLTAAVLACVMAMLCLLPGLAPAEAKQKKYTVMIYMCGADLESKNMQGSTDISKILRTGFNRDEINVVLLLGGSTMWGSGYSSDSLTLLEIGGRRPTVVEKLSLAPMSDPETLSSFLAWSVENYPADNYILDIWDHGGGPILGVCQDMLFRNDTLSLAEIDEAMKNSPFAQRKLDLVLMNTCLMGSAEFAAVLAPYARYMVATEDSQYGLTYDYLTTLETEPDIVSVAARVAESTYEFNKEVIEKQKAAEINSVAVVDLGGLESLRAAVDAFFSKISPEVSETSFTAMSGQRRNTRTFGITESGGNSNYDLVDLGDLVNHLSDYAPEEAGAVKTALEACVVRHFSAHEGCSGLTVYHPFSNKRALENYIAVYNTLSFSPAYTGYIQQFASILSGVPLAVWKDLRTGTPAAQKDNRTLFTLPLTADQAAHFGEASMEVLLRNEDGTWQYTFMNPDVSFAEAEQTLTSGFNGAALYAVSPEGKALTGELEYARRADGTVEIPAVLSRAAGESTEEMTHQALILCQADASGKELTPGSVLVLDEAMNAYTPIFNTTLQDYDEITLTVRTRRESRDENGTLRDFAEWEEAREQSWTLPAQGDWQLRFVNDTLDPESLYAIFRVTDSQNNVYSSEPKQIKTSGRGTGEVAVQYEDAGLVLIDQFTLTAVDAGLMMGMQVTNITDQEAFIRAENVTVNGTAVNDIAEAVGSGDNWGLVPQEQQTLTLPIDGEKLAGMTEITSITFDLVSLEAAQETEIGRVPVTVTLKMPLQ